MVDLTHEEFEHRLKGCKMCNLAKKHGICFRFKSRVVLLPEDLERELSPDDAANLGYWLIVHASAASDLIKENTKESIKRLFVEDLPDCNAMRLTEPAKSRKQ